MINFQEALKNKKVTTQNDQTAPLKNLYDFGFEGEEFSADIEQIPYCQFLNASTKKFGIAVTVDNAELAEFRPDTTWQLDEHEFVSTGEITNIFWTQAPRMLVLGSSPLLMQAKSEDYNPILFDRNIYNGDHFNAFSYKVVYFLDKNNKPLSKIPFRIKLSGYAGTTFNQKFSNYRDNKAFCSMVLKVYKKLSGDKSKKGKSESFYAHAVFMPTFKRENVTNAMGLSSFAVKVVSFVEPTEENFLAILLSVKNPENAFVAEAIEATKDWIDKSKWEKDKKEDNEEKIAVIDSKYSELEFTDVPSFSGEVRELKQDDLVDRNLFQALSEDTTVPVTPVTQIAAAPEPIPTAVKQVHSPLFTETVEALAIEQQPASDAKASPMDEKEFAQARAKVLAAYKANGWNSTTFARFMNANYDGREFNPNALNRGEILQIVHHFPKIFPAEYMDADPQNPEKNKAMEQAVNPRGEAPWQ